HRGAVVADVPEVVVIGVSLAGVGDPRAIVADISRAVVVRIGLVGVGEAPAVVAQIAEAVGIGILLAPIAHRGTVVAHVPHPVVIDVRLVRVVGVRAVVHVGGDQVSVGIGAGALRNVDDAIAVVVLPVADFDGPGVA